MKKRIAAVMSVLLMLAFLCSAAMADEVSVNEGADNYTEESAAGPEETAADPGMMVSLQAATPEELKAEYAEAKVVLDFYCLAVMDNGEYKLTDAYKDLDLSGLDLEKKDGETDAQYADRTSKELAAVAQEALQMTFADGSACVPAYSEQPLDQKIEDVPLGMYMVLPHGSDLTSDKYVKKIKDENNEEKYVTIAQTEKKEYRFLPIITLLNYDNDGNSEFEIKVEGVGRYGSVAITKKLTSYEKAEEASFAFRVIGVNEDGDEVFNDVCGFTFSGTGTQTATVDKIPVGAKVTVTEIYSGSAYAKTGDEPEPVTVVADKTVNVTIGGAEEGDSFINYYTGEEEHGHGFLNSFKHNGTTWEWYKDGVLQSTNK